MYITYIVGEFLWMQGQLMLHPRQYDMCVWVEEEGGKLRTRPHDTLQYYVSIHVLISKVHVYCIRKHSTCDVCIPNCDPVYVYSIETDHECTHNEYIEWIYMVGVHIHIIYSIYMFSRGTQRYVNIPFMQFLHCQCMYVHVYMYIDSEWVYVSLMLLI